MNRIAVVVLTCVVGCVTWVQSGELGDPWLCGVVSTQQQPDEHDYWDELAPLPLGGVDRVIWDGSFQEATSGPTGPGGRWFGLHAASLSAPATDYREVLNGDDGGYLKLVQTKITGEAWVHGFQFGEALGGVEEIPVSPLNAITLRFRARTPSYHPSCDPFSVVFFVHDRSVPGEAKQLLASEQMFIPDTGGLWVDCELSVRLDSGTEIDVFDAAQWAPRVVFNMWGDTTDQVGVLHIDDIEVVISKCMREPVGLQSEHAQCSPLMGLHPWWSFMCEGEYAGGGEDGTSPLEWPESGADIDGDCEVAVGDLLAVIKGWGVCPEDECCLADINGDGLVDVNDLLAVISAWGEQCE